MVVLHNREHVAASIRASGMTSNSARAIFTLVCILILISASVCIGYLFVTTPVQIKVIDYDAYREEAEKIILEEATSLFNIAILVFGASWAAMIVSKENRLRREDRPEIIMFCALNVIFIAFLYFNWKYGRTLAQLYWDMGPSLSAKGQFADVMNSGYVLVNYRAAQICFYGGLLMSALCTFSHSMLRRSP